LGSLEKGSPHAIKGKGDAVFFFGEANSKNREPDRAISHLYLEKEERWVETGRKKTDLNRKRANELGGGDALVPPHENGQAPEKYSP